MSSKENQPIKTAEEIAESIYETMMCDGSHEEMLKYIEQEINSYASQFKQSESQQPEPVRDEQDEINLEQWVELYSQLREKTNMSAAIKKIVSLVAEYTRKQSHPSPLQQDAVRMDKELNMVHACLTELYNIDQAVPIIKKCLNKIDKL